MSQYQKFLIVASKLDKAGINITTQLSQFGEFKFYLVDKEIIYTENLDLEKINSYDFVIFASKHKSESREKTLSVHAPGNWRLAEFGGEKNRVCRSSALFMKHIFEKMIYSGYMKITSKKFMIVKSNKFNIWIFRPKHNKEVIEEWKKI